MIVVHGLWAHRQALCLWVEHPGAAAPGPGRPHHPAAGSEPLHPRVAPLGDARRAALAQRAPVLAAALERPSRAAVQLLLPTAPDRGPLGPGDPPAPGAVLRVWRVPAVALNPDRALAVLTEVAALAAPSRRGPAPGADGAGAVREDDVDDAAADPGGPDLGPGVVLGEDLAHLAAIARAALDGADAARVVPDLADAGGEWWPRWAPLEDAAAHRWRTAAAASCPPVLRAEVVEDPRGPTGPGRRAADVVDDLVREVTDLVVRSRLDAARASGVLAPAPAAVAPDPDAGTALHPAATTSALRAVTAWTRAVATGAQVEGVAGGAVLPDLARRVGRWRASATGAPVELLLRVVEPTAADTGAGRDLDAGAEDAWALRVRLRSVDDPGVVLTCDQVRSGEGGVRWTLPEDPWAFALGELARAGAVHPPLLSAVGARPDSDVPIDVEQLLDLVGVGMPALVAAGFAVQLPGRWLKPALSVRLSAETEGGAVAVENPGRLGKDQLVDYRWQVALGDDVLTREELTALAAAKADLVRLRGQWVQIDAERIARSLRFLERSGQGTGGLAAVIAQLSGASALPAPVSGVDATGWLGDLLSGQADARVEPVPTPVGLRAVLRPYQERGLAWLSFMTGLGLGVVLADDMGLGKTVQLLALLVSEHEAAAERGATAEGGAAVGPTLLVCPMSVVGNWQRETAQFAPGLRVLVHHGPERSRGADLARDVAGADLVLTTYDLVARDVADLSAVRWHRVALDEAQHVKNASTRAARAVRAVAAGPARGPAATTSAAARAASTGSPDELGATDRATERASDRATERATHRVALTGTPVENRLEELRAVLDFTNPGVLGSAQGFRERFAVPVERHRDPQKSELLATLTRPFVLRRLKTDPTVISDLPEKLEMVVRANLTAEQASLYQAVVDDMLEQIAAAEGPQRRGLVLSTLTKLKQVCNHPAQFAGDGSALLRRGQHRSGKLALVDDVLDAVVADGERALLFTQYREFGAMVAPHLAARYDAPVPFLHGGVAKRDRDAMVEGFSAADGPPVMLLSLKAGGTGLNLVAANHVVHLDRWWNPAVEDQATDRAFRIGQTRQVQVRKLVCVGTVEERIQAMMAAKKELAQLVVGTGEGWLTELSTEELRDLLVLGADAVGD